MDTVRYLYRMPYKIALVDDQSRILDQLSNELNSSEMVDVVFTARNGADYLLQMKNLPAARHPQVVLMDIEMPVMGGIEAVLNSCALYKNIRYLMFTVSDDDDKLFDAIVAGAHGYLLKDEQADVILEAIKEIIEKEGSPMSPSIARKTLKLLLREPGKKIKNDSVTNDLSDKETKILKAMVTGLNYKQIGVELDLSPFTIRNHISKIYSKLHITSKAQAINLAINNKWT